MRCPSLLGLGLLLALSASAQQKAELRARELFYTPVADVPAKAAETKPTTKVSKPVTKPTGGTGSVQANRKNPVE